MGIRGTTKRITIDNTVVAEKIFDVNPLREGYTLLADPSNGANNIFIGFDDPAVLATGDKAGIRLQAGEQIAESPPSSFTGEIYAIASAGSPVLIVREDTKVDD